MPNDFLVSSITDELFWDPLVDSSQITVAARGGHVTLSGTVGTFRETRAAQNAAERVLGATGVDNRLKVRLANDGKRSDAEIRNHILQALRLNSLVPSTVDLTVEDGFVCLVGAAQWQHQRDEAERVATNVPGVVGVRNEIALTGGPPELVDVKQAIENAFRRNAALEADDLAVEATNGTIVLKGVVRSWPEHDAAIEAAWAAPGVRKVDDQLLVGAPRP